MARIIAIDRKPRVVNRRLVTDAFGAECCCGDTGLLDIFSECCDNIPAFAVSREAMAVLRERCDVDPSSLTILVRRPGSDTCYRGPTSLWGVTREQAAELGYAIIEDADQLVCVEQGGTARRCGATATACRECPDQCCLMTLYRKSCPDVRVQTTIPKENVCCNHGRQARRTWRYLRRTTRENYLPPINSSPSIPDPNCPPGCYVELLASRSITVETGTETAVFTACPESLGGVAVEPFVCERAEHYASESGEVRRYFQPGIPCYQGVPELTFNESRSDQCQALALIPPISGRAVGEQVINEDGTVCMRYYRGGPQRPVCGDIRDHVCEFYSNNRTYRNTITTNFRYSISCTGVNYRWEQTVEVRWGPNFDPSCPAAIGTLVSRTHERVEEDFVITRLRTENCPDTVCDGYAREGVFAPDRRAIVTGGAFLFL